MTITPFNGNRKVHNFTVLFTENTTFKIVFP